MTGFQGKLSGSSMAGAQRWQAAVAAAHRHLFAGPAEQPWRVLVSAARAAALADLALFAVYGEPSTLDVAAEPETRALRVVHAVGASSSEVDGRILRLSGPGQERIAHDRASVLIIDTHAIARLLGPLSQAFGSLILSPVRSGQRLDGALLLARQDEPAFGHADLSELAVFAQQTALALELARTRADQERLRLVEDHQRIAAELQQTAVAELFTAGIALESTLDRLDPVSRKRVAESITGIDHAIHTIRDSLFRRSRATSLLGLPPEAEAGPVRPSASAGAD